MTATTLLTRYNSFNGKPLKVSALKSFHTDVQKYLDSVGSGPGVSELKGVMERVAKAVKYCRDNNYDEIEGSITPVTIPSLGIVKAKPKKVAKKKESKTVSAVVHVDKKKKVITVLSKYKGRHHVTHPKVKSQKPIPVMKAGPMVKSQKTKAKLKGIEPSEKPAPIEKMDGLYGALSADNAPAEAAGTFRLPGVMGDLLGNLQRYKLQIIIPGETHSSKSQLGMQIANAFASLDDKVYWIDWEQGGLTSVDTQNSIKRNVDPENRKRIIVSGTVPRSLDAVKAITKNYKVIAMDSGTKLNPNSNAWVDSLREEYPDVVWIIMMQQTDKGTTRGGSSADFDAPVVLKTQRPDESDFTKNYAKVFKNRGNKTGIFYSMSSKQMLPGDPEKKK